MESGGVAFLADLYSVSKNLQLKQNADKKEDEEAEDKPAIAKFLADF